MYIEKGIFFSKIFIETIDFLHFRSSTISSDFEMIMFEWALNMKNISRISLSNCILV